MKNYESLDYLARFPFDEIRLEIVKLKMLNALILSETDFNNHSYIKNLNTKPTLYDIMYVAKSLGAKNSVEYLLSNSSRDKAVAILEASGKVDEVIGKLMVEELQRVPEVDKILSGWYDER